MKKSSLFPFALSLMFTFMFSLMMFSFAFSLGGCGKDQPTPLDLSDQKGDTLSGAQRKENLVQIEKEYEVRILVSDSSYAGEHSVNRVYRFLFENISEYRELFKKIGVLEVWISDEFNAAEIPNTGGKLALRINRRAPLDEIRRFLGQSGERLNNLSLRTNFAKKTGLSVRDARGMAEAELRVFLELAQKAAVGFDFTQRLTSSFHQAMSVDQVYAVSETEFLVPANANEDSLRSYLGQVIELAKTLKLSLSQVSSAVGVTVTIQPEVLTPAEIQSGIDNLKKNAELLRAQRWKKCPILLGRRNETDPQRALSEPQLLVAFDATPAQLTQAMVLRGEDLAASTQAIISEFTAAYRLAGVQAKLELTHFWSEPETLSSGSVDFVQSALTRVRRTAPPELLAQLRISRLTSVRGGSTSAPEVIPALDDRSFSLVVRVDAWLNEDALSAVIHQHQARIEQSLRAEAQRALVDNAWREGQYEAQGIRLDLPREALNSSTGAATLRLAEFMVRFKEIAPARRLLALRLMQITFAQGAASEEEAVLPMNGKLRIDPYRATAQGLEQVLQRLEIPVTSPIPSPTASPSPRPSRSPRR